MQINHSNDGTAAIAGRLAAGKSEPTHLAIAIKPRDGLSSNDRRSIGLDLLCCEKHFRREFGILIEVEPQGASALLACNWPSTVWARAAATLNGIRKFGESRREPDADYVRRWQAFWGGVEDGEVMVLLPLPAPASSIRKIRDLLRMLPASIRWRFVCAGTPQERLLRMLHRF